LLLRLKPTVPELQNIASQQVGIEGLLPSGHVREPRRNYFRTKTRRKYERYPLSLQFVGKAKCFTSPQVYIEDDDIGPTSGDVSTRVV
jgi:hypothetical protein